MILTDRERRKANNDILSTVESLRSKYGEGLSNRIMGLNFLLANVYALKQVNGHEIVSNEDYFSDENGNDLRFSRKFLSKRLRLFQNLLWHANNFDSSRLEDYLIKQENELNGLFLEVESNGQIKWLNKSGFYSFYRMIRDGYVTYGDFGEDVERFLQINQQ